MTEETRKLQLAATVDAADAKKGFNEIKDGARDMAAAVRKSGEEAGKGVDGIGAGADVAAKKVDAATRSIIGSIQRATALQEAGTRGSTRYYEALAAQRGVPVDALRPYLTQLDAVNAKQAQATAALSASAGGLDRVGLSAKQTAFALRGVPAQFTDIFTSLQGGQAPLTVLLQQGGQLKDMFGGIGPAARALGGYIAGLVNPFTVAAAAIGLTVFALNAGSRELREFQNAATISGSAIGTNLSQFTGLRDSLAGIAGTKGKAAEALTEIARNGKLAGDNVNTIAEAAILMEKATGQAIGKTVDQFARLAESPSAAALELNKQYNFLTASVYAQIKALEEQGKAAQAADVAEKSFADTLKTRSTTVVQNTGLMEKAWRGLTGVAKGAWDAMLNVGREDSLADKLTKAASDVARVQAQLVGVGGFQSTGGGAAVGGASAARRAALEVDLAAARQREAFTQESVRLEKRGAEAAAEANRVRERGLQATVAFGKLEEQSLTKRERLVKEIAQAERDGLDAGKSRVEIEKVIAGIRERNKDTSTGAAGTGQSEVASIRAKIKEQQDYLARLQAQAADPAALRNPVALTDGEKQVLKIQEELKTSISGVARAQKEKALAEAQSLAAVDQLVAAQERQNKSLKASAEAYDKLIESTGKGADSILQQALGQEAANAAFGKSKTAIEAMTLAQLKNSLAEAEASDRFAPAYIAALAAKTEAQERYVAALQQGEVKQLSQANAEAARLAAEETQTLSQQAGLLGLAQVEREKIIAQRKVELDLAKRITEIDRATIPEAEKARLRAEASATAVIAGNNAAAQVVQAEWQRTADAINTSITDALLRGFEKGKGFAENLRDTIVNMFKTMVLRPVVSAVVNTGTQTVSQALGIGGGQQGGGIGGLASNAQSAYSLYSNLTGNLTGNIAAGFAGGAGLAGATTVSTAAQLGAGLEGYLAAQGTFAASGATAAGVAGAAGGAAASAGAAGAASGVASALAAVPGWGWAALAGIAILGMSGKGGGPKTESGGGLGIDSSISYGGPTADYARGIEAAYASLAKNFGLTSTLSVGAFSSADPQGDSLTALQVRAGINGRAVYDRGARFGEQIENVGRSDEELQAALAEEAIRVTFAALRGSDLESRYRDFLNSVWEGSAASVLESAINRTVAVKQFDDAIKKLPFDNLKSLSFAAAEGLLAAAGGFEALSGNLSTYYDNFYTAEEKRAQLLKNVFTTLGAAGADVSTLYDPTLEAFRALAEAQDLATASGQKTYAALLSVSGAFAELAAGSSAATETLKKSLGTSIGSLSELSRALETALENSTPGLGRADAQGQIASALAAARAGGALPTADALAPALKAIAQPSEGMFRTFIEWQRDQARTANDLQALADLADSQITIEQQMLDALLGIDRSVISVAEALGLVEAEKLANAAAAEQAAAEGRAAEQARQVIAAAQAAAAAAAAAQAAAEAAARAAAVPANLGFQYDWSSLGSGSGGAGSGGDGGTFAVGTNYVPYDMRAQIHQGERIIPAADNRELMAVLRNPAAGNDVLVAEVRALRQELAGLRSSSEATASNTGATERSLRRMSSDGNSLDVKVVPA